MKQTNKILAILLCLLMIFTCTVLAYSESATTGEGQTNITTSSVSNNDSSSSESVCEFCGKADGHEVGCLMTFTELNQTATFVSLPVTLYYNPITEPTNYKEFTESDNLPENFTVQYSFPDENGTIWYMLDTENWDIFADTTEPYSYIQSEHVVLDGQTTVEGAIGNCTVSVVGNIPTDSVLELSDVDESILDLTAFGQESLDTIVTVIDIKVLNVDGLEWQPAEGEYVTITLETASLGLGEGMPVSIQHEHDGVVASLGQYTVTDGKLSFTTDGFSIFMVTGLWGTATSTTDVNELNMYVGDVIFLREDNRNSNNWQTTPQSTTVISIATYTKPDNSEGTQSYCMVTANTTGSVTLSCGNNNSVEITVTERPAGSNTLKIDDTIFTNGCLVPELSDTTLTGVTYKWYKNANLNGTGEYTEVTSEAVSTAYAVDGGVNVAVDQGGKCWYKVEAYNADGTLLNTSDSYWVSYSNELENGSFETPQIEGYNPFDKWGDGNVQFNQDDTRYITTAQNVINGTALWWRTTGYGSSNNADGRDIEIIKPSNTNQTAATGYYVIPADELQYAELNCETIGTLYQDVLTAPNTTLTWTFSHRGREGTDTMAAVIMPAAQADDYAAKLAVATTTREINSILAEIATISGAQVWNNLTADNTAWETHTGTYQTVEGQYLSRFFFVSVDSASTSNSMGNFIDGVSFDDRLNYTIRYYVDGVLQESETGKVKPYTTVTASRSANYSAYALDKVVKAVNGTENLTWGSTSMKVEANDIYLDLHYITTGISIAKKVVIDNSDGRMTAEEVAAAQETIWRSFGNVVFALKDSSGNTVATATVTVNEETGEGVALFVDNNGSKFVPTNGATYTITETSDHKITGYIWTQSENVAVFIGSSSLASSAEYVNTYKAGLASLTIKKSGAQSIDENQSFIFTVVGTDENTKHISLTVVVNVDETGEGEITIENLPVGQYTVTENTGWSWRYTPDKASKTIALTADGANTVPYSNTRNRIYWLSGDAYAENRFKRNEQE